MARRCLHTVRCQRKPAHGSGILNLHPGMAWQFQQKWVNSSSWRWVLLGSRYRKSVVFCGFCWGSGMVTPRRSHMRFGVVTADHALTLWMPKLLLLPCYNMLWFPWWTTARRTQRPPARIAATVPHRNELGLMAFKHGVREKLGKVLSPSERSFTFNLEINCLFKWAIV